MDKARDEAGRFVCTHGGKRTKLYRVWCSMKERCNNPNNKSYKNYGAAGIRVCSEWEKDFDAFKKWCLSHGYAEGLTIDRIDGTGNYEPSNCRWVTYKIQNRNYRRNHFITYKGVTKCLADWADEFGINRATVLFRLKQGKPLEEVFSKTDGRSTRWQK